ncbi:uncharacterized protein CLUP02_15199 [Colletotrichum lupini]|uniref:Uncharacterized protein n=1 Tax=Colletotrichum lupini TaxID=145971 RepID=A0A9Q8T5M2_9PEZI|nr:uncharacterized protein CLUP02_15199 [Colletotrichum lupini]UQC89668.1 hypothetical protein CLUP02_15199 [Colletotrichum lupini]
MVGNLRFNFASVSHLLAKRVIIPFDWTFLHHHTAPMIGSTSIVSESRETFIFPADASDMHLHPLGFPTIANGTRLKPLVHASQLVKAQVSRRSILEHLAATLAENLSCFRYSHAFSDHRHGSTRPTAVTLSSDTKSSQSNLPAPYRMTLTQKTKTALAPVQNNMYSQCRGPLLSELNRSRARLQPLPSPDWGMGNQNRAKRAAPATPHKKQLKPRIRDPSNLPTAAASQRPKCHIIICLPAACHSLQHQVVIRRTRQQENHGRAASGILFSLLPRRSLQLEFVPSPSTTTAGKGVFSSIGAGYKHTTGTASNASTSTSIQSFSPSNIREVDIAIQRTNDVDEKEKTNSDTKFAKTHDNRLGFTYTESMSNEIHPGARRFAFRCLAAVAGITRDPCHRVPLTYTVESGLPRRRHIGHPVRPPVSGRCPLLSRWIPWWSGALEVAMIHPKGALIGAENFTLDPTPSKLQRSRMATRGLAKVVAAWTIGWLTHHGTCKRTNRGKPLLSHHEWSGTAGENPKSTAAHVAAYQERNWISSNNSRTTMAGTSQVRQAKAREQADLEKLRQDKLEAPSRNRMGLFGLQFTAHHYLQCCMAMLCGSFGCIRETSQMTMVQYHEYPEQNIHFEPTTNEPWMAAVYDGTWVFAMSTVGQVECHKRHLSKGKGPTMRLWMDSTGDMLETSHAPEREPTMMGFRLQSGRGHPSDDGWDSLFRFRVIPRLRKGVMHTWPCTHHAPYIPLMCTAPCRAPHVNVAIALVGWWTGHR